MSNCLQKKKEGKKIVKEEKRSAHRIYRPFFPFLHAKGNRLDSQRSATVFNWKRTPKKAFPLKTWLFVMPTSSNPSTYEYIKHTQIRLPVAIRHPSKHVWDHTQKEKSKIFSTIKGKTFFWFIWFLFCCFYLSRLRLRFWLLRSSQV